MTSSPTPFICGVPPPPQKFNFTANARISAQGAYFTFFQLRWRLIEEDAYFILPHFSLYEGIFISFKRTKTGKLERIY